MQVWACFAILAKYLGKYKAGCMTQFKTINEYDTRQIVLDAVHELYASSQVASRSLVTTMTGLKPALVDDSIKVLCNDNKIRRIERGVYVPVWQYPEPRQIWQTKLYDGTVKVDIGDDHVLTLTPQEASDLGLQLAGYAMRASNMGLEQKVNDSVIESQKKMDEMFQETKRIMNKQARLSQKS